MSKKSILLATTNLGKLKELQNFLSVHSLDHMINVLTLKDFPLLPEVEETQDSFLGNALLKAKEYYKLTHIPIIADDSGLVVSSLNGAPGIYSARYAGSHASFQDNITLLLNNMQTHTERSAYFRSCIVFLWKENLYTISDGYCYGEITQEPLGDNGFGYDPIFYLSSYQATMAQISFEEKQKISHRSMALNQLLPLLKYYAES